jgi:hypothetical protein
VVVVVVLGAEAEAEIEVGMVEDMSTVGVLINFSWPEMGGNCPV